LPTEQRLAHSTNAPNHSPASLIGIDIDIDIGIDIGIGSFVVNLERTIVRYCMVYESILFRGRYSRYWVWYLVRFDFDLDCDLHFFS